MSLREVSMHQDFTTYFKFSKQLWLNPFKFGLHSSSQFSHSTSKFSHKKSVWTYKSL
jgi:hypothetical protein